MQQNHSVNLAAQFSITTNLTSPIGKVKFCSRKLWDDKDCQHLKMFWR